MSKKHILILAGIGVHVLFYLSLWHKSHFLNRFFPAGQLHFNYIGLDFLQVPCGAYTFFRGGDMMGITKDGGDLQCQETHNKNVYHPVFTVVVGGFLQLFSKNVAVLLWQILKLLVTMTLGVYLFRVFKDHQGLPFALFIFFSAFDQYHEIKIAQFQFYLNALLTLFLISMAQKRDFRTITYNVVGMLVKPVGLLYLPIIFIKKKWKLGFYTLLLFMALTIPWYFFDSSSYYFNNIFTRLKTVPWPFPDMYNMAAFLYKYGIWSPALKWVYYLLIALIAWRTKLSFLSLAFLAISGFHFFDYNVYQYHYTMLIPFFVLGPLLEKEWDHVSIKFLIVICSLPSIFIFYQIFGIHSKGGDLLETGWPLLNISKWLPLLILNLLILYRSLRFGEELPILKRSHVKTAP